MQQLKSMFLPYEYAMVKLVLSSGRLCLSFPVKTDYAVAIGCSLAAFCLIAVGIAIVIWKKRCLRSSATDKMGAESVKPYHAFISYVSSRKDEVFVYHTLLPRLEEEGCRLCVHHRDFTPGEGKLYLDGSCSLKRTEC